MTNGKCSFMGCLRAAATLECPQFKQEISDADVLLRAQAACHRRLSAMRQNAGGGRAVERARR